jgi:pyridoxamine 5'-phosphate oxidase-like protein
VAAEIDIADLVRQGVAVIVATRDPESRPELSRAWGPALSADGARLTVCVEAAADSAMARNLESGSPVAATLARLAAHTSVQLKGPVVEVATPTQERLDAVSEHVDGFVAETAVVGVPESLARALVGPNLLTVTIEVAERFDETPGSDAGRPL